MKKIGVALMLALAVAAPAGAQTVQSGWGTAVIDGVIDNEEWATAAQPTFPLTLPSGGGTGTGAIFVMNDATTLYIAAVAVYTAGAVDFTVQFDASGDGQTLTMGDDAIGCQSVFKTPRDTFRTATTAPSDDAPGYNATIDVECGATKTDVSTYIELSHPLDSGDGRDISVAPLDLLPFYAQVRLQPGSVDSFFPGPVAGEEGYIALAAPEPSGVAAATVALALLTLLGRSRRRE